MDLVSHTTYVACFNLIHEWLDLQFVVDSERQIFFWEMFHGSQSFCQKSAEWKTPKKLFFSTETLNPALSRLLYSMISSLMNALVGECFWLREIFINVNKLLALMLFHIRFLYCTLLLVVYFLIPFLFFLVPTLLLYICLFDNLVNKLIIFVFGAFAYNFKNTISIFVMVLYFIW